MGYLFFFSAMDWVKDSTLLLFVFFVILHPGVSQIFPSNIPEDSVRQGDQNYQFFSQGNSLGQNSNYQNPYWNGQNSNQNANSYYQNPNSNWPGQSPRTYWEQDSLFNNSVIIREA